MAMYNKLEQHGGISKVLGDLKDQDFGAVLAKIREVGGKDVEPAVAEMEKALKDAGGEVSKIDWKGLGDKLKGKMGAEYQAAFDVSVASASSSRPLALKMSTDFPPQSSSPLTSHQSLAFLLALLSPVTTRLSSTRSKRLAVNNSRRLKRQLEHCTRRPSLSQRMERETWRILSRPSKMV